MSKRLICFVLTLCVLLTVLAGSAVTASAGESALSATSAATDAAATGGDYGLADKVEDGNILHCFNWTLSQIKEELPNIAKAGFTSVQTSPLQSHVDTGAWYWLYQPTSFNIGNELGSYQDLCNLCSEADNYGIKIIVDVVANHLAGWNDGTWNDNIDGSLRNSDYFHNQGGCDNWDNRYDVTHKNIGMPDLNSENEQLQNIIAGMITGMKNAGVDGIRWDAAKHIGLPSEGCGFWSKMAGLGLYNYGEILDNPAGSSGDDYNNGLMKEYASYIGVTDSSYSGHITGCVRDGQASGQSGNWNNRGVPANRIVYWGESHDTFCNYGWTNGLSVSVIDRAYAVLGARANSQALYFSRPYEKNHDSIRYGLKGSTHFTDKEVAAINHFHNAMVGTGEYYTADNNCFVVCRGGGAVIVSPSGSDFDVTVTNGNGMVPAGTYTDEVSGSTWTVDGSSMHGHIGGTGIAVIYNKGAAPTAGPSVSANPGSCAYRSDILSVTLSCFNADSASYSVDGGSFRSFTSGDTVTIGSGVSYGSQTTLTLKAEKDGKTAQQTYTYTKVDPSAAQTVYFDNNCYNWSQVYCYMYNESGSNAEWPGAAMTRGADNTYYYDVPDQFKNAKVLFTEDRDASDHRYPGGGDPGLDINGESMLFSENHSWTVYGGSQHVDPPQPTEPPYVTPTQAPTQAPTQDPITPPTSGQVVLFNNNYYNWSQVYCYMYNESGSNADWPGEAMTRGLNNIYYYTVPERFSYAKVLFTEDRNASDHRYPGGDQPGLDLNGESMLFSQNNSWNKYYVSGGEPEVPQVDVPEGKILVGDANGDRRVTILDVTAIQRHIASIALLSESSVTSADVDRDGKVTVIDATAIQRQLAGLYSRISYAGQIMDPISVSDPEEPTQSSEPSGGVILNASATSAEPEAWYAWTWKDGEDGRWVKGNGPVDAVSFSDLDGNVIFVRANPDMDIDWHNGSVWNQTNEIKTRAGGTFVTSGWQAQRILGDWT